MDKKELDLLREKFTREKIEQAYQDDNKELLYRASVYFPLAFEEFLQTAEQMAQLINDNPSKIDNNIRQELLTLLGKNENSAEVKETTTSPMLD
ncbi:hypothetical protein U8V72_15065 [Priestia filamentosa]|uniref:hypothetical protein n=1 Tax=Priestia filamentosa TaxID=1402861 RepID=UPI00397B577B